MKLMIFRSTRDVILMEKTFRTEGISCRVIPVPRSVSPNCGMALEFHESVMESAEEIIRRLSMEIRLFDRNEVTL